MLHHNLNSTSSKQNPSPLNQKGFYDNWVVVNNLALTGGLITFIYLLDLIKIRQSKTNSRKVSNKLIYPYKILTLKLGFTPFLAALVEGIIVGITLVFIMYKVIMINKGLKLFPQHYKSPTGKFNSTQTPVAPINIAGKQGTQEGRREAEIIPTPPINAFNRPSLLKRTHSLPANLTKFFTFYQQVTTPLFEKLNLKKGNRRLIKKALQENRSLEKKVKKALKTPSKSLLYTAKENQKKTQAIQEIEYEAKKSINRITQCISPKATITI